MKAKNEEINFCLSKQIRPWEKNSGLEERNFLRFLGTGRKKPLIYAIEKSFFFFKPISDMIWEIKIIEFLLFFSCEVSLSAEEEELQELAFL